MVSGFGARGGKGRCFPFWQEFVTCMNSANRSNCKVKVEDYKECLHHKKLNSRTNEVLKVKQEKQKAGTLAPEVDALWKGTGEVKL
eukprot:m.264747 g.264747  ORF g.264747 m.264747 type:complete len:86 (+) comp28183_c0_seq1:87-344(+)